MKKTERYNKQDTSNQDLHRISLIESAALILILVFLAVSGGFSS